jgi:hypothetical protein
VVSSLGLLAFLFFWASETRRWLTAEPRLAPDAQAPLDGSILLAVAYGRPHEHGADDHERHDEKHDENHDDEDVHSLSLPVEFG